ncbi:MAG: TfpX/TfpZ family type IV pilin accessory protein [Burkholderiaceae bacterium]|nr:TfpX/TfpZ family type IV pilin accessory protein [Burkholderiaceae bacterium]
MNTPPHSISRFKAASLHLLASGAVAALSAALVFLIWYPPPYDTLAGGASLFVLIVSVDVVLGPALTAVAASPGKSRSSLLRDLAVIVAIQLAAFGYGLYTMALARPVLLAFEVDRLRVVTAADIDATTLTQAPVGLQSLSWIGPRLIAAPKPIDPAEQMSAVQLGLAGVDLSMQPKYWRDYASQADAVWRVARPVSVLLAKYPQLAPDVAAIARSAGQPPAALRFLPLMSRRASWVSLVASPGAQVVGHLPVDGFF